MSNRVTLQDEWEHFAESVIPDDADAVQIGEMKLAFYSGALIVQSMTTRIAIIDNEDEAVERIDQLYNECASEVEKIISRKMKGMMP